MFSCLCHHDLDFKTCSVPFTAWPSSCPVTYESRIQLLKSFRACADECNGTREIRAGCLNTELSAQQLLHNAAQAGLELRVSKIHKSAQGVTEQGPAGVQRKNQGPLSLCKWRMAGHEKDDCANGE